MGKRGPKRAYHTTWVILSFEHQAQSLSIKVLLMVTGVIRPMVSSKILMPGCSSSTQTPRCLGDDIRAVGAIMHYTCEINCLKHTCFAFQTFCVICCSHKQHNQNKVHQNNARHPPAPLAMYWHVCSDVVTHHQVWLPLGSRSEFKCQTKSNPDHIVQKVLRSSGNLIRPHKVSW